MPRFFLAVLVALLAAFAAAQVHAGEWPSKYDPYFRKYAKRYFGPNVDWRWFKAQGIAESALQDSAQSAVGATIYAPEIPVSDSLQKFCDIFGFDPLEYALSGGEDYTLVCTVASEKAEEIAQKFQNEFNRPLYRIGKTTATGRLEIIYRDGTSKPISPQGWDHFKVEKG